MRIFFRPDHPLRRIVNFSPTGRLVGYKIVLKKASLHEIDLNGSEIDLNESEIDLNGSEIDLNKCEHFLKVNLNRSEIDLS